MFEITSVCSRGRTAVHVLQMAGRDLRVWTAWYPAIRGDCLLETELLQTLRKKCQRWTKVNRNLVNLVIAHEVKLCLHGKYGEQRQSMHLCMWQGIGAR